MERGSTQAGRRPRVLIAGGGVAALEAMLALRGRAEVELHAPRREFAYRPLAVGEPFGAGRVLTFDLADLAERAGASFRLDSVIAVDGDRRHVVTRDGHEVPYDYLLLAHGVRMLWAVPGAVTFWGVPDEGGVAEVVRGLREGELRSAVFTMPGGASWSLPIYELALLAEASLSRAGVTGAELKIVTPEDAPLRLFGVRAAGQVTALLGERGIETIAGVHPVKFDRGLLHIAPGEPVETDAVVSLPRLEGRRIAGVPHDQDGFIPVDEHCRALGMDSVFAAGDVTAFPVKQGGIAAQQADVAAEAIAAEIGAPADSRPFDPILRGTLWTGEGPRYLYGRLTGGHGETSELTDHAHWEHEGKIVGEHLAPFLDSIPGAERPGSQTGDGNAVPTG
ncbi:MAG TPA: FAD-dependent oxidoreductase [Solirubrobacterales bacterium]|nr:FAD-dependent oxidoreductase [Solirubrobacterales bacterium]